MDLDTRTFDSIAKTISDVLNIDIKCLERYLLDNINFESPNWYYEFIDNLKDNYSDELDSSDCFIYFHTLTRRLNIDKDKKLCNLKELLLSKNIFILFCNGYGITFKENKNIEIFLNDKKIDYTKGEYLKGRLVNGIGKGPDICVNGFLIRDNIEDYDSNNYYNNLGRCPEFINRLFSFLNLNEAIINYYNNSTYYIYTYRVPIKEVDLNYEYNSDEIIYHVFATMCLAWLEYKVKNTISGEYINKIVFVNDDFSIDESYYVERIKID